VGEGRTSRGEVASPARSSIVHCRLAGAGWCRSARKWTPRRTRWPCSTKRRIRTGSFASASSSPCLSKSSRRRCRDHSRLGHRRGGRPAGRVRASERRHVGEARTDSRHPRGTFIKTGAALAAVAKALTHWAASGESMANKTPAVSRRRIKQTFLNMEAMPVPRAIPVNGRLDSCFARPVRPNLGCDD